MLNPSPAGHQDFLLRRPPLSEFAFWRLPSLDYRVKAGVLLRFCHHVNKVKIIFLVILRMLAVQHIHRRHSLPAHTHLPCIFHKKGDHKKQWQLAVTPLVTGITSRGVIKGEGIHAHTAVNLTIKMKAGTCELHTWRRWYIHPCLLSLHLCMNSDPPDFKCSPGLRCGEEDVNTCHLRSSPQSRKNFIRPH